MDGVFRPGRSIDAARIADRVVIHDLKTSQTASLDPVGSLIWLGLDGQATVAEVAQLFDHPEAADGVLTFVSELVDRGLVVSAGR